MFETIEITVSLLVKYVPEYRNNRRPELMAEIQMSAEYLYAFADELLGRIDQTPAQDNSPKPQKARQLNREMY